PGALDRQSGASTDRPGDDEPRLATLLRPRPGRDGERLRHAGHAAQPSGAARLAGHGVRHGAALESESDAPVDRYLGGLPPIVAAPDRPGRGRSAEPAARAAKPP